MKKLAALALLAPTAALAHPGHSAGTTWFFHDGPLIGLLALAALAYIGPELARALRRNKD
ncbi:MAG: hypothetical protein H5U24_04640 [Thioclava marina]|uniref:hypothetical protein n=1 Tax=Thioclava TaxID=285107 RepID=UPI000998E86D|nr:MULTISPECIES: hypothetical protein [Thioclava]MBC7144676.1 hypothetical protein [Thioclava marina]MBD3804440.1 hypothetical protein [Thioclava sp.]TNE82963.1 MAG: hypothetical protein EP337_17865 [Paracoccaceae bacterium]